MATCCHLPLCSSDRSRDAVSACATHCGPGTSMVARRSRKPSTSSSSPSSHQQFQGPRREDQMGRPGLMRSQSLGSQLKACSGAFPSQQAQRRSPALACSFGIAATYCLGSRSLLTRGMGQVDSHRLQFRPDELPSFRLPRQTSEVAVEGDGALNAQRPCVQRPWWRKKLSLWRRQ